MIDLYYLYIFNPYSSVENFCNVFYLKLVNLVLIHFCIQLDFSKLPDFVGVQQLHSSCAFC